MKEKKFKRRKYFIRESSQSRIIIGIQLIFFIMMLVCGGIFYKIANKDLTESYFSAHMNIKRTMELLLPSLLIINFVGLIITGVVNVFFTHRIIGPIHRLCRILMDVGRGNLTSTIKFREHDELKELERASNEMVSMLRERIQKLKAISLSIEKDVVEMSGIGLEIPDDIRSKIGRVVEGSQDFIKEMAGFKV